MIQAGCGLLFLFKTAGRQLEKNVLQTKKTVCNVQG
jgi:hypothetical protein